MEKGDIILIGGLNEEIATIKQEKQNNVVIVEKKVFDALQKNNLDLMEKLDEAIKTLKEYACSENWKTNDVWYNVWYDGEGYEEARECLNSLGVKYDK